jgi:hypothetical protein
MAEAIPTHIQPQGDGGLAVVPTRPGDPVYQQVSEVLTRGGAADAGLAVTDR